MPYVSDHNKFSYSKSPWITRKESSKEIYPEELLLQGHSIIKHVPSNKSDFRPNTLLCYLSTCYRRHLSTNTMIVFSMRTKNMDFRCPPCIHFPQKYDHIRPQGRPHENEFKLFSNTKNKCHKSWNWKGRWKNWVWFPDFFRYGP